LKGSTDDYERTIARGRLTFFTNFFRLDSVYGRTSRTGTSDFRGGEFTFSGIYRTRNVSIGVAIKSPTTITRKFTASVQVDTTGTPVTTTNTGQDELELPWRGMGGIAIVPTDKLTFGMEYEIRPFASAIYREADGTISHPWLSASVFHAGIIYAAAPWLSLRGGVRGQVEIFEPEGNPIVGEAVSYSIYSAGAGVTFAGIQLNLTYEYAQMKYQDVWGSAISLNKTIHHTFVADVVYEIPGVW
jgi:opacity protein-like surface antigen